MIQQLPDYFQYILTFRKDMTSVEVFDGIFRRLFLTAKLYKKRNRK